MRSARPCGSASTPPAVQITLMRPVSSSRLRNTTPLAVSGCWRWVTTPATSTTDRSGRVAQRLGGDDAAGREVGAHELGRVPARGQAGGPEVGRGLLHLGHPRQRGRLDARDDAGQRRRLDPGAGADASRNAPAAHNASRRSTSKHANAPAVASDSSVSTGVARPAGEVLQIDGTARARRARRRCGRAARRRGRARTAGPMRTAWIDGSACQPGQRDARPARRRRCAARACSRAATAHARPEHLHPVTAGVAHQRVR